MKTILVAIWNWPKIEWNNFKCINVKWIHLGVLEISFSKEIFIYNVGIIRTNIYQISIEDI